MISAIAVRNYLAVLSDKTIPAAHLLAKSGIEIEELGDPDYLIEMDQYRTVVGNILRLTGDGGVGFELGIRPDIASLGVLGHAVATCTTVRDTHKIWLRFGAVLVGNLGRLEICREDGDSVSLAIVSPDSLDPLYRFSVEEMLGLLRMIGPPLVGHAPPFMDIKLSYLPPPHASRYGPLFDCPIQFSAATTEIKVTRKWFDSPVRTRDHEFNNICVKHCESLYVRFEGAKPMTAALRSLFVRQNGGALPTLEQVSSYHNLTPRTLRRRLQAEGTTYREQIDEYRAQQAKELFSFGTVSPKEAAFLLGFKEESSFRHAFKNWTGQTISEFRSRLAQSS